MNFKKPFYLSAALAIALTSCKSVQSLPDLSNMSPIKSVNHIPTRTTDLSEEQLQRWSHLDVLRDTVPGMSVDRAYESIIKNKKGQKVVVAVIDSGIEIDHEDLKHAIWHNPNEKAGNGIDDDNNGYVDDINGWNFLGKSNAENLEFTRIVKKGDDGSELYKEAKAKLEEELAGIEPLGVRVEQLKEMRNTVTAYLGKDRFEKEDLMEIPEDAPQDVIAATSMFLNIYMAGRDGFDYIDSIEEYYLSQKNHHLNVDFDGRAIVGDNPHDINDTNYGDNDVLGDRDHAKHGTHVAGIIAQKRGNDLGGDGVADKNVEIMSLRAVPDGDEYDKDIALAIRYAADNGAKVINGSFGKYFAQNNEWVYEAIQYAAEKDVLIVVAAGNDSMDLNPVEGEEIKRYPNDRKFMERTEIADNFLVVGALNPSFGEKMIANFSNFGHVDVDVFAPGVKIYATVPHGEYEYLQGTSMASPNAAGVAALIRSYFPTLTAPEVKQIMKESGVPVNLEVIVSGDPSDKRNFQDISTSGKFVNLYNALIMADKVSKAKN